MSKPVALERMVTDIAGLDAILEGGFLKGGVYLVWGDPGVGKTILGNQLCYRHVRGRGQALYLTLLAESHVHMMQHMSGLSFFDENAVPNSLSYVSGYSTLTGGDLRDVLKLISREISVRKATLLVIDGLGIVTSSYSGAKMKEFIHELQTVTQAYGCTTFLLTDGAQSNYHPENTMVDGLIALYRTVHGTRSYREIEVLKLRGSKAIFGRHTFTISDDGFSVYPRIEALFGSLPFEPSEEKRMSIGLEPLDVMLKGGLPSGTTTMVLGPPGVGKTILGLHFCSKASAQEPALFFSLYETPARLVSKAGKLGIDLSTLVDRGHLEINWASPPEQVLDDLGARLKEAVTRRNVKRLFIDGLDGFRMATPYPDRVLSFFTALENEFRALGVTSIYSTETKVIIGPEIDMPLRGSSLVADNLILFRFVEQRSQMYRFMSILKVRDSDFDQSLREFRITSGELDIADDSASAEAILTGRSTSFAKAGLSNDHG